MPYASKVLVSRDGKSSVRLKPHGLSFDLSDAVNVRSNLRYSNATPQFSGGNFTIVTILKPTNNGNDVGRGPGFQADSGVRFYTSYPTTTNRDGYANPVGVIINSSSNVVTPNPVNLCRNTASDKWQMTAIGLKSNGTAFFGFNDGTYDSKAIVGAPLTTGIYDFGVPTMLNPVGSGSLYFDDAAGSNGRGQCKVALVLAFNRALSPQELLDLYGMLMLGQGYAISPVGLVSFWYPRKERRIQASASGGGFIDFAIAHGLTTGDTVHYRPKDNVYGGILPYADRQYFVNVTTTVRISCHPTAADAAAATNAYSTSALNFGLHYFHTAANMPAYSAVDVARATIGDLSLSGNSAYLFTDKTNWTEVLDSSNANSNPGIYIPQEWIEETTNVSIVVEAFGSSVAGKTIFTV